MTASDKTKDVGSHTPGPWDFGPGYEPGKSTFDLFGPGGRQVIASASYENMWLATYDADTDAANARLIAAAPEMYAVLYEMFCEGPLDVAFAGNPKAIAAFDKRVRAVIDKATTAAETVSVGMSEANAPSLPTGDA